MSKPVAWLWSRLQRPRYDFPVDWQMTRYHENIPTATHVRPLVDAHPEDAPGGPWEVLQDDAVVFQEVDEPLEPWWAQHRETHEALGPVTHREAIAVRDVLNGVDRLRGEGAE